MTQPDGSTTSQQTQAPDWFQALLSQGTGGMVGGTGANSGTDILQQTLMGLSGRQGLTSQPLVGLLPKWVYRSPQLLQSVQAGTLDPYLVQANDPTTWRVYVGNGSVPVPRRPSR